VRKLPAQGTHQQDATVLTTGQHTPEAEFAALRLVRNPSSDPAVAHTQTGFTMWRLRLPPGGVDLLPSEADTAQDPRENMWKLLYRVRAEIDLIFLSAWQIRSSGLAAVSQEQPSVNPNTT